MRKLDVARGGRGLSRSDGGIVASAVCFLALVNSAYGVPGPPAPAAFPRPVRRQDELFNGRRPDVWQLLVLVDGQIRRRVSTADAQACRLVAAAVAVELIADPGLVSHPERVRITCEPVSPGAVA